MTETTCQQASCTDTPDTTVEVETGEQYDLCEDHAHMNPNGTPVDGYDPNDPAKFTDPEDAEEITPPEA